MAAANGAEAYIIMWIDVEEAESFLVDIDSREIEWKNFETAIWTEAPNEKMLDSKGWRIHLFQALVLASIQICVRTTRNQNPDARSSQVCGEECGSFRRLLPPSSHGQIVECWCCHSEDAALWPDRRALPYLLQSRVSGLEMIQELSGCESNVLELDDAQHKLKRELNTRLAIDDDFEIELKTINAGDVDEGRLHHCRLWLENKDGKKSVIQGEFSDHFR